ncbi:methyltransferase domain-containing protein [Nocardia sp. SYP-A9097]|uniref:class I SAM-dependent methyltransferase n=1 Tax=Nocardia sp. SYP-A9097 TaxID=2663237 RepID=UPI00129BAF55|nr:class I SAM-dependent methyltransferase [Nocardia sp. SYP-A9097]MRH86964.1 methyltransferase domain-containing protein [Nocardia sp. SYP-A9097]
MSEIPDADRWNTNIQYHGILVDAVAGADAVLDVGCGEGMLTRRLRQRIPHATGIDLHEPSIELARAQGPADIDYLCADFLTHPFAPESFDGIVSVATLHHMDPAAALTRMAELLRPGGTLALTGLAMPNWPRDIPRELGAGIAYNWFRFTRKRWEHPSPIVWPPPHTYADIRELSLMLPGRIYRRHLFWRYSITWTKPR